MPFPKLKHPSLCRVTLYFAVLVPLAAAAALIIFVADLLSAPNFVILLLTVAALVGIIAFLIKNYQLLFAADMMLAAFACELHAQSRFPLPESFSAERAVKRLSRFGSQRDPAPGFIKPDILRFKSSRSFTVYARAIEKTIAVYHVDFLDPDSYRKIIDSAQATYLSLKDSVKHRFLEPDIKKAPLNRVIVIVIFAKSVDAVFASDLGERVGKNGGDGYDASVLPCVVDLGSRYCFFDARKEIYNGFQYPVKNRGIKLIRRYLFGGRLPVEPSDFPAEPGGGFDPEMTVWAFVRRVKHDLIDEEREAKKRYGLMKNGDVVCGDGVVYVKLHDRAIMTLIETDEESRKVNVALLDFWDWPNHGQVAAGTKQELRSLISEHFREAGYVAVFEESEEPKKKPGKKKKR